MFVVYEVIDTGLGMDDMALMSFDTEIEAQNYIAELEAFDIEDYGEVIECYWYDKEEA